MSDAAARPAAAGIAHPSAAAPQAAAARELMACTTCDALHEIRWVPARGRLRCRRCGATLLQNPQATIDAVLATSIATAVLIVGAIFSPFLRIEARGFKSDTTLIETALAFSGGLTTPLALAVLLTIVIVPIVRAAALAWALLPVRLLGRTLPLARPALRLGCDLRPWSMAEVFIIGVAVALVKIGGMATIGLGAGFWELVLIVAIVAIEGATFNERTLWRAIQHPRAA